MSIKHLIRPDYAFETRLQLETGGRIAGVDEAGRGPWAGPVVAAAVIFDEKNIPRGLNDSKKLSEKKREILFEQITQTALVGVGLVDVETIDRDNILVATLLAMSQAVKALPSPPAGVLIDGNKCPDLPWRAKTLVKGDQRSLSIAAASIIAKVTRDRIMVQMARAFPQYGFERHKGYGTKAHAQALTEHGITPHHRRSFKPIRRIIEQSEPS